MSRGNSCLVLTLSLTNYVSLEKLFHTAGPQFSYLETEHVGLCEVNLIGRMLLLLENRILKMNIPDFKYWFCHFAKVTQLPQSLSFLIYKQGCYTDF